MESVKFNFTELYDLGQSDDGQRKNVSQDKVCVFVLRVFGQNETIATHVVQSNVYFFCVYSFFCFFLHISAESSRQMRQFFSISSFLCYFIYHVSEMRIITFKFNFNNEKIWFWLPIVSWRIDGRIAILTLSRGHWMYEGLQQRKNRIEREKCIVHRLHWCRHRFLIEYTLQKAILQLKEKEWNSTVCFVCTTCVCGLRTNVSVFCDLWTKNRINIRPRIMKIQLTAGSCQTNNVTIRGESRQKWNIEIEKNSMSTEQQANTPPAPATIGEHTQKKQNRRAHKHVNKSKYILLSIAICNVRLRPSRYWAITK